MLNDRKRKILQIIIEDYIETAEPVGSRTIARKHNLGLSPATIRNEMSDLELLGYLEQPHTSAGRVPSAQAYRLYVDSMVDSMKEEPGVLTENDRALINSWYKERIRNMDDIFKSTAKILSRMTQNVSLVLANKKSTARFKYLKFLPLSDTQARADRYPGGDEQRRNGLPVRQDEQSAGRQKAYGNYRRFAPGSVLRRIRG